MTWREIYLSIGWLVFCILSILVCLASPETSYGYNTSWPEPDYTYSKQKLEKELGDAKKTNADSLVYEQSFFNRDAYGLYYFDDKKKLNKYFYLFLFESEPTKKKGPKTLYHEVHTILKQKHGQPTTSLVDYKLAFPPSFDSFYEQVAHTERVLYVQWQTKTHDITWLMVGFDGTILAYALYQDVNDVQEDKGQSFDVPPELKEQLD